MIMIVHNTSCCLSISGTAWTLGGDDDPPLSPMGGDDTYLSPYGPQLYYTTPPKQVSRHLTKFNKI